MNEKKYVSRGGDKLEGALEHFKIEVAGKVCLDVGASTGGFTDCLLQHGAAKVYAVDTAYGELAWKLRNDPKVVVLERRNILFAIGELDQARQEIDLAVLDLGWTRLHLGIPRVMEYLKPDGVVMALIKPQYELVKVNSNSNRKTVLEEDEARMVAEEVREKLVSMGHEVSEPFAPSVKGESGNQEYFVVLRRSV